MTTETEDLTGRDRLTANLLISWFSYLVFFIAGFVLPHLIDDHLGQAMLGIWDFSWSLVNYFAFAALGIGSNLNRHIATFRAEGRPDKVQEAASTVVVIQLALAALVAVAVVLLSANLELMVDEDKDVPLDVVKEVFLFLGLALAAQFVFDTSRGVLTGCHRWDIFNVLNAGSHLLTVVSLAIALYLGYGLETLALIYLVFTILVGVARTVISLWICPESAFSIKACSTSFARTIFVFGGKSILLNIPPLVVIQTTSVLVMSYLGPAMLAVLARPLALMRHVETFLSRFTFILVPMAGSIEAMKGSDELREFALMSARMGFAFTAPILLVFGFYGDEVIRVWMGEDYVNQALIYLLAGAYLLPVSQSALIRVLIGIDQHGTAALISVIGALLVYVVAALWAAGQGNLLSWALAIVLPIGIINGLVLPVYACRRLEISLWRYASFVFPKVLTICGLGFVQLYAVEQLVGEGLVEFLVNCTLFGLLVATCYWIFLLPPSIQRRLRQPLKSLVMNTLYNFGVLAFIIRANRNKLPILTVHGVGTPAEDDRWLPSWPRCSTERLDRVMTVLGRFFDFVSLDEAADMLSGKVPFRPGSMLVTFDDGYRNNLTEALPILRKHGCPLNVYVSTGMIGGKRPFWIDRVDFALQQLGTEAHTLRLAGIERSIKLYDLEEMARTFKDFRHSTGGLYDDDYELSRDMVNLATELEAMSDSSLMEFHEHDKWSSVVSEQDLRETVAGEVCVGSHTVNHVRVDRVSEDDLRKELQQSKQVIESLTGRSCRHFCYPNGDFSPRTAQIVAEEGFDSAVTGERGINRVGDNMFQLRRYAFPNEESEAGILFYLSRSFLLNSQ